MSRKTARAFGLCLLVSCALASCYYPGFIPRVTGVSLDRDELRMSLDGNRADVATLTAALVPHLPSTEAVPVTWTISDRDVVDFVETPPDEIIDGNVSRATILAWGPGEAEITVRVLVDGGYFQASCAVTVTRR